MLMMFVTIDWTVEAADVDVVGVERRDDTSDVSAGSSAAGTCTMTAKASTCVKRL